MATIVQLPTSSRARFSTWTGTQLQTSTVPLYNRIVPLTGKRILITRSRHQASELASQLQALGAETILIPTIELAPPASYCTLDAALASLRSFDWLLFTSANAVHAFDQRARQLGLMPSARKVAAIGPATAKAVQEVGLTVDLLPQQFVAESLVEALLPHAPGASMLLVRAESARDLLSETLTAAGAQLTIAPAYRTIMPVESLAALQYLFSDIALYPDAITFTSVSTVTNLFALLEGSSLKLPETVVRASIGPITSRALRDDGYPPHIEANEATITALATALLHHLSTRKLSS